MLISSLGCHYQSRGKEQTMSNDTIKRSDAIKALDNAWINGTSLLDANEAVKQLNDLPSAYRPQGEWIKHEHGFWTFVTCAGQERGDLKPTSAVTAVRR